MPAPLSRLCTALLGAVLLTGCTSTVVGAAAPENGLRTDVSDAELTVGLAGDGETDRIARNSLADVLAFWDEVFPQVFGEEFGTVEGGFWSIDPAETGDDELPDSGCFDRDVGELAGNAFYCPPDDAIFFDRAWMADLAEEYGPFVIAEIMAHEMGHAVQGHAGIDEESIVIETQAECFAGAWTRWVVDGNSRHFTVRAPALDPYLLGYLYFGDPAGTSEEEDGAHGSLFDQLSAFQEGYADGAAACAAFDSTRFYTQDEFDEGTEEANMGNLPFDESLDSVDETLTLFWQQAFAVGFESTPALGGEFAPPELRAADGDGMVCSGQGEELDLQYCAEDGSVRYDTTDLLEPAHDEVGDFAVDTLLALPYGLAVRAQRGLSTGDPDAVTSVVCAAGWYARELSLGTVDGAPVTISPGDVDEAAVVLLQYATMRSVLPDAGLSGFELVDYFRQGFVEGGAACGL
ncbi:neutral zinc metallopeptidase [Geodermatophilus sp. SYSU D00691]